MKKEYIRPSFEVTKFEDFFFNCLESAGAGCSNIQPDEFCLDSGL